MTILTKSRILIICSIAFVSSPASTAPSSKLISIRDYLNSRANVTDPVVDYMVNLRCAIVYHLMANIADKNSMSAQAKVARGNGNIFMKLVMASVDQTHVTEDRVKTDLKVIGDKYTDMLAENYAITGSYFNEPTFKDDQKICQELIR
jgi:hypothetical protein